MHFYSRLSGNQKCKAFLNSNGSPFCVFAASAPAFRPLFTAFQPTILAIKGSCDTTNSSSTCHDSKVLSIIHDQFSKVSNAPFNAMQTYSIPLIYPLRSNSDHNPEAQNEHEKNWAQGPQNAQLAASLKLPKYIFPCLTDHLRNDCYQLYCPGPSL